MENIRLVYGDAERFNRDWKHRLPIHRQQRELFFSEKHRQAESLRYTKAALKHLKSVTPNVDYYLIHSSKNSQGMLIAFVTNYPQYHTVSVSISEEYEFNVTHLSPVDSDKHEFYKLHYNKPKLTLDTTYSQPIVDLLREQEIFVEEFDYLADDLDEEFEEFQVKDICGNTYDGYLIGKKELYICIMEEVE